MQPPGPGGRSSDGTRDGSYGRCFAALPKKGPKGAKPEPFASEGPKSKPFDSAKLLIENSLLWYARVAKLADAQDLKSWEGNLVRVRVPPWAPFVFNRLDVSAHPLFLGSWVLYPLCIQLCLHLTPFFQLLSLGSRDRFHGVTLQVMDVTHRRLNARMPE